jgi:hypothetical protein
MAVPRGKPKGALPSLARNLVSLNITQKESVASASILIEITAKPMTRVVTSSLNLTGYVAI